MEAAHACYTTGDRGAASASSRSFLFPIGPCPASPLRRIQLLGSDPVVVPLEIGAIMPTSLLPALQGPAPAGRVPSAPVIVVADDDPDCRHLFGAVFALQGYVTLFCRSEHVTYEHVLAVHPDLLLL